MSKSSKNRPLNLKVTLCIRNILGFIYFYILFVIRLWYNVTIPSQLFLSLCNINPEWHSHLKLPWVLTQDCWQSWLRALHSSKSKRKTWKITNAELTILYNFLFRLKNLFLPLKENYFFCSKGLHYDFKRTKKKPEGPGHLLIKCVEPSSPGPAEAHNTKWQYNSPKREKQKPIK